MAVALRLARLGLSFFTLVALSACNPPTPASHEAFRGTDLTGAAFGKNLQLTDHTGKPRSLADFRGKVVVVFFGYTHCPDVCPTTLSEMAAVAQKLGPEAQKLQVLFVTLDPERDTPQLLAQFVPAFNPDFLGLYGGKEATARVAKEFRVFYQKNPGQTADSYTLDHSAGSYVYDTAGRLRLFLNYGSGAELILHDIKLLLSEKP
jgi:protein SCO1